MTLRSHIRPDASLRGRATFLLELYLRSPNVKTYTGNKTLEEEGWIERCWIEAWDGMRVGEGRGENGRQGMAREAEAEAEECDS